ncbi:transporter substrate-binding domain-containing protein [Nitratireductor aquimarinus]|uniref:transporter substrate-binding domain-containing protein n=1 Tax=Nitratireductor aquimarinus TaxID=889300 RepID=UPI0029365C63|nr:transporter substrate-binding domain-containing protein [Nitratireductor aquimarinus]MDV2968770.1 transporter substrate-binding domain-containing protein [Nitratireductor aquimarinus]
MNRILRRLPITMTLAFGLALPAAADTLETVKKRNAIAIGIKNDYKPFGYLDENGEVTGFEIDLAKFIGKEILGGGGTVELVPVVASNRIELLNAGRIDLILATLGVNEKRAQVVDFTEEFYNMAGIVLMAPNDTTLATWDDVNGQTLCGIQGNLYNRPLEETYGADMMLFPGTSEMFSAYEDGRCAAIAFDGPILNLKLSEPGWGENNKIAVETFDYIPIAGGVRKGDTGFLEAVDAAILKAEAEGLLVEGEKTYSLGTSQYVTDRAEAAKAAGY